MDWYTDGRKGWFVASGFIFIVGLAMADMVKFCSTKCLRAVLIIPLGLRNANIWRTVLLDTLLCVS
jgi:hypothetical protein